MFSQSDSGLIEPRSARKFEASPGKSDGDGKPHSDRPSRDGGSNGESQAAPPTTAAADAGADAGGSSALTVIEPVRGWRFVDFRELWRFRELIGYLVWRDVKIRYKQTFLGASWAIFQPLMMMVVFTVFFGKMAGMPSGDLPYPLFAFSGLLPWMFFATAVTNAGNSVVQSERLVTKIYFPRLAIPLSSIGAALVDFCVAFGLLTLLMAWYGEPPGWTALWLAPIAFLLIMMAALGLGTLLAALNVSYRDFKHVIPFLVQLGMFATPTIYIEPPPGSGATLKTLVFVNPMASLIATFRASVLGRPVDWDNFLIAAVVVLAVFMAGCLYFRKVEDGFADVI